MKKIRKFFLSTFFLFGSITLTSCEIDPNDLLKQLNVNGYVVGVKSANYSQGYAGIFTYMEGSQPWCRIEAIPYDGYKFKSWNDSVYENPYAVPITKSEIFTVYFERSSDN